MSKKIEFTFKKIIITPNDRAWIENGLSLFHALVWGNMANSYNLFNFRHKETFEPTIKGMARYFGITQNFMREIMEDLEDAGLITFKDGVCTVIDYRDVWNVKK